jgi:hypothetical protein
MQVHYCMGKVAGAALYTGEKDHCGKCGMKEKRGGCCKDEFKVYKLADSYKNVTYNIRFGSGIEAVAHSFPVFTPNQFHPGLFSKSLQHYVPPDFSAPPLCVLNCVFRI